MKAVGLKGLAGSNPVDGAKGEIMKYKEFVNWCNERCCDGCWGSKEAMLCITFMNEINKFHFWQRNKIWHELYEKTVVDNIIEPINEKRRELGLI